MEIILKENVVGLGYKNDIVTVKDGYGRNYLIPSGKAVIASQSARKQLAETLRQQAKKIEKLQQEAQTLQQRIEAIKDIVISAKVSATGTIYGSVNNQHLAEELQKRGIELDRRIIAVKDVKSVGNYIATVQIYKGVTAELPFTVIAEGAEAPVEEAPAEEAPAAEPAPAEEVEAPAEEEAPAQAEE